MTGKHLGRALLISVRPRYAELIFAGSKTVELRRTKPSVAEGCPVAIYVSSPDKVLRGFAEVAGVETASARELWDMVGQQCGIGRREFFAYYAGSKAAYGIRLRNVQLLAKPQTLAEIRDALPGFCPPQVFRYLSDTESRILGVPMQQVGLAAA